MKDTVKEAMTEMLADIGNEVIAAVIDASYIITLIGGTIFIILYVAGWEKGMRYTGILFVCYILLRAILGVL